MIVLGHRGGRGEGWPAENTLEAFARALAEGAAGVELDVRQCATGEVVVLHDVSLDRVTGGADRRAVHAVRRAELPRLAGGEAVPDLEEALELLRGRLVNVELKSDVPSRVGLVRGVARALRRVRGVDVVLSSFDPRVVVAAAALVPRVPRAILVGGSTAPLATALPLALKPAVVGAHLADEAITAGRARRLRGAGLRLVAWTVNQGSRAAALRTLGVDWLITDRPGEMLDALGA